MSAAFPPEAARGAEGEFRVLPLAALDANPAQPRRRMDDRSLVELAASISERGVIEPLIVAPRQDRFLVAAGERRFRAAKMAGLMRVPCLVRTLNDTDVLEIGLIENIQREDVNAVDEAECIRRLLSECRLTFDELGRRIGKTKSYVSLRLSLLDLPPEVVELLRGGRLSAKHARYLLQVESPERRLLLARKVVADGLSSRQTQELVDRARGARTDPGTRAPAALRDKLAALAGRLPPASRLALRDDRISLTVTAPDFDRLAASVHRAHKVLSAHASWRSSRRDDR